MTGITRLEAGGSEVSEMRRWVMNQSAELLAARGGELSIDVVRSKASTSYDCYEIVVRSRHQSEMKLFLKDFGHSKLFKDEPRSRWVREIATYRDILDQEELGTPLYVASRLDASSADAWLLLEYVEGTALQYLDVSHWVKGVEWLGRLHGLYASRLEDLATADFLVRRDHDFNAGLADDALTSGCAAAPEMSDRVHRLVAAFRMSIPRMMSLQPTLVHGAFRAREVLISLDGEAARVTPVDWELASYGSGFLDLAHFTDGFKPPILDHMFDAYIRATNHFGLDLKLTTVVSAVNWFRLAQVMRWLAMATIKRFDAQQVAKVIEHGERVLSTMDD